jgi:signal transduction histidine kinase
MASAWRCGIFGLLGPFVVGLLGAAASADRSARFAEQARQSDRVLAAGAEFLRDTIDRHERLLAQIAETAAAAEPENDEPLKRLLALAPALMPDIAAAAIVEDGSVLAKSKPGLPDRVLLAAAGAPAGSVSVFFGARLRDAEHPLGVVAFGRPVAVDGEGKTVRLALLVLDRSLFDRVNRVAALPPGAHFSILRQDGTPLFGEAVPADEAMRTAAIPGVPLILRYEPPAAALEMAWRADWTRNAAFLGGMTLVAAYALLAWRRRNRRRARYDAVRNAREALKIRRNLTQLTAAATRADEANRTKSRFLAHVTHELRTPLNAILGFSEAIRRELFGPIGNPRYANYAGLIHDAGSHLLSLIDDLLDMAKVEAGKMQIAPIRVSPVALSRSVLDMVEVSAQQRSIALAAFGVDECPDLYVDLRAAKQILINLLANAIKFTAPGGRVDFRFASRADGGVTITVADTGIGMSKEDIVVAFEAFGRVAKAPPQPGTGLGLPLARALVGLHRGELSLTSEIGYGTTVTVVFPPETAAAKQVAPTPLPPAEFVSMRAA